MSEKRQKVYRMKGVEGHADLNTFLRSDRIAIHVAFVRQRLLGCTREFGKTHITSEDRSNFRLLKDDTRCWFMKQAASDDNWRRKTN